MAYFLISLKRDKSQEKILDVSSSSNLGASWKIVRFVMDSPVMLASFAVGVGLVFTTSGFIYSLRSVNRLVLQGNNLRVVTHTPLGGTRSVTVPISDVSCTGSRIGAKPQVPLKLKGYRFFFLLDKEGEFMQPTLFDKTVGIKRF